MTDAPSHELHHHHRRAAADVSGNERASWLSGSALVVALVMIIGLLALIFYQGGRAFWPGDIERVSVSDGSVFLGVDSGEETIGDTEARRIRFLVGNRDLGQQSYRWVDADAIASRSVAGDAVQVERDAWGVFIGEPRSVVVRDGSGGVAETVWTAEGGSVDGLRRALREASRRRSAIRKLSEEELPAIERAIVNLGFRSRAIERRVDEPSAPRLHPGLWVVALLVVGGAGYVAVRVRGAGLRRALAVVALAGIAVAALEHPWSADGLSEAAAARKQTAIAERVARLESERDEVLAEIGTLRAEDERVRLVVADLQGRIAPRGIATPDEPMVASEAVGLVGGELGFGERVGVYLRRWWSYLSRSPGEAPGSGGIWPVIQGTVVLTLLLTAGVMPLGVIAALYLREYAKQGIAISAVRIAINNLAGVPSIVYGMFGLGFFCYGVGGFVDRGPETPAPMGQWWLVLGCVLAGLALTAVFASMGSRWGGVARRAAKWLGIATWLGVALAAGWLISQTPYFDGFFEDKLPEQSTFGGRGILWASLTMALLTLPVVIVATEEALAAVPNSVREGSFGCGASRWQTVRRVVLPSALPGIMTGAILAMARGAGEVAPLMLVGAVNLSPAPAVSGEFPFIHGDRTFMHLGFHIYNLGFQSPDAEATEPLVWTTTLTLIAIVLTLNLTAVIIRGRLRTRAFGVV